MKYTSDMNLVPKIWDAPFPVGAIPLGVVYTDAPEQGRVVFWMPLLKARIWLGVSFVLLRAENPKAMQTGVLKAACAALGGMDVCCDMVGFTYGRKVSLRTWQNYEQGRPIKKAEVALAIFKTLDSIKP